MLKEASVTIIVKVKGVVLKNFLGVSPPNPLSSSPVDLLIAMCDCYVQHVSKLSFYNSIQLHPPPSYATTLVGKKVGPKSPRKLIGTDLHTKKILSLGTNLVYSAIARNDFTVTLQDSK